MVVLGGAKPSDKLAVIANLLDKADRILIGGGMSYTFLKAQGHEVGKSLLEADRLDDVRKIMADAAAARGVELVLPVDLVGAADFAPDAEHQVYPVTAFPADRESLDMGPATQGAVRRQAGRRGHGLLERPGRGLRVPGLRRGHPGGRAGHQQAARPDGGGRR